MTIVAGLRSGPSDEKHLASWGKAGRSNPESVSIEHGAILTAVGNLAARILITAGGSGRFSLASQAPLRGGRLAWESQPMTKYSLLRFLGVLCLALGINLHAAGQSFPTKPVRLIVPFPAGGGSDVVGRILAQKLSERLAQQVIVDNRPGAGGSIGTEVAVRSAPDGYTMVLASTSEIAVNPAIYSKLSYDTLKDLTPVAMVASTPMVVIVSPALPVKNIAELIALAKAKPGEINVASAGNGSFTHLASELFRSMTGVTWTHVPYKGAPPAIADLASGRAHVMFSTMPAAMGSIKGNLVKPIAVSSPTRAATLPDVPTVIES